MVAYNSFQLSVISCQLSESKVPLNEHSLTPQIPNSNTPEPRRPGGMPGNAQNQFLAFSAQNHKYQIGKLHVKKVNKN